MIERDQLAAQDVDRFIIERIDSVPHLEALLLIWTSRPKSWSVDDLAQRLYIERNGAIALLQDLVLRELIARDPAEPENYLYEARSDRTDNLVAALHAKYRAEIVAVSTMIHRKASSAVRDFADAFRFKKERG